MAVDDPMRVYAYSLVDGRPVARLPYTSAKGTSTLCQPGQMEVGVKLGASAALLDLRATCPPWKVGLAATVGGRIFGSGPVTSRKWDPVTSMLTFTCGDGWAALGKRIVISHQLANGWSDGEVVIDDDHPAAFWRQQFYGASYTDIASQLIEETERWGPLPIDLPSRDVTAATLTHRYDGWDLTPVQDRILDLTKLEHADEMEFYPYRDANRRFRWLLRGAPELMDNDWQWSCVAAGQQVQLIGVDEDGADMCSTSFGLGGRSEDLVLAAKVDSTELTGAGWPVLQAANTSHSSVSELDTLRSYCAEDVWRGSNLQESIQLKVSQAYAAHPGDYAEVRVRDPYMGNRVLPLKIVQVDWGTSQWLTVSCRIRGEG